MPPKKRKGITRNVGLEQELIRLGADEDDVLNMTPEEQGAEYDRLNGLAPRDLATAFDQTYTDNQQQAAANAAAAIAANPPPPPPAPVAPPAAPVEDAAPAEDADPLEGLIRLGVARDAVFGYTRNEQQFEYDRIQSLAPRAMIPPALPAEIDAPTGLIVATVEIAGDVVPKEDDPMDLDEPAPTGIVSYGRIEPDELRRRNNWLLQQPMQPPIAARPADEPAAPRRVQLGPIPAQVQRMINEAPNYQTRRQHLDIAINNQWAYLMEPPAVPHVLRPDHPMQPDIQRRFDHLPLHLQFIISRLSVPEQREFMLLPLHSQWETLYRTYSETRRSLEQFHANNRSQIDLDPLLIEIPELHVWLYNASMPLQTRWVNSTHNERMALLRENGLLAWMQQLQVLYYQRLSAQDIQQLPAHVLQAEDMARYNTGFGYYMTWFYSADRRAWIEMMVQSGQM